MSLPKVEPDRTPLTQSQAKRLSGLTRVDASEFAGRTVAEIRETFRWQIDPGLFLFHRICGQVVKQDATGVNCPVPFASVSALDTSLSLLGYLPPSQPWAWFFPFQCETETAARTTTDASGHFCFWVPRFEIDWILRKRRERISCLELFTRPTVADLLQYLQGLPIAADAPEGIALRPGSPLYRKAEQLLGRLLTRRLAHLGNRRSFSADRAQQQALLSAPAFSAQLAPALPREFQTTARDASAAARHAAIQGALAEKLGLPSELLANLNVGRFFGPFLRSREMAVPQWVPFFEIPDLSFRVIQNVAGPGTEEVIYAGGLFDVPWSTGGTSSVTLIASNSNPSRSADPSHDPIFRCTGAARGGAIP